MTLYVAIDQGGHATRAFALDETGSELASAFVPIETRRLPPDRVEHDADQLAGSVSAAIDALAAKLGDSVNDVAAAGLATQRSSIACWHRESGDALAPVLSWQDVRAAAQLDALRVHESTVREITGLRLSAHYGASKLRWCLDRLPLVADAYRDGCLSAGPLASFLLCRLLHERPHKTDPVNASRTLLCDLASSAWSPTMLGLFGIPERVLPRIVPNAFRYGHLDIGARRVPLTVCTGDQTAALFAHGRPARGCAYVNVGTGAFVQALSTAKRSDDHGLLESRLWHDEHGVLDGIEGTINGAGAAVRTVAAGLGFSIEAVHEHAARWMREERAPPLFINAVSGLAAPFWRTDLKSTFVGDGSAAAKMVAVFDSIVFLIQENLAIIGGQQGRLEKIVLTGGIARVDPFCQCIADLSGLPVTRPAAGEATARGLGFLLAGLPSDWPAQPSSEFLPRDNAPYLARCERWRAALQERLDQPRSSFTA